MPVKPDNKVCKKKKSTRDRRQVLFLEGPIPRALITLAIPIILGNILQTGYQLTDAFWVGRLDASAVAAISIAPFTQVSTCETRGPLCCKSPLN